MLYWYALLNFLQVAAAMHGSARTAWIVLGAVLLQSSAIAVAWSGHGSHDVQLRASFRPHTLRLRGGGLFGGQAQEPQAAPAQPDQAAQQEQQLQQQQLQQQQGQQQQPQQPPQQSIAQHAYEYALAGSMDGIRSGMGQSVGSEVRDIATKLLQRGLWLGGMAFVQFFSRLPFLGKKIANSRQGGVQGAQGQIAAGQQQPSGTGVCVCFVTAPTQAVAEALTQRLVESGAAACVNELESVKSTYIWEGKMQRDSETLLIIKTQQALVPAVQALVKETHPHQLPEVIAFNVEQGLPEYLQWVMAATGQRSQPVQPPLPGGQPSSARAAVAAAVAAESQTQPAAT